jgi:hypothetical protein
MSTVNTNALAKMSKEQLLAMLENKLKADASGLIVKLTDKGGVYIRHDSFKEFSTAKGKEYTAGINLGFVTAKSLFNNPELINQIRDAINAMK